MPGEAGDRVTPKESLKVPDAKLTPRFVSCPRGTDFPLRQLPFPGGGPPRSQLGHSPSGSQCGAPSAHRSHSSLSSRPAARGPPLLDGSRLSQDTELRSLQQDSWGGAWPVGHASDTPLCPPWARSTAYSSFREGHAPPRTRPPPTVSLRPLPICQVGGKATPPSTPPPPRPAPLRGHLPQQSPRRMGGPRPLHTPIHHATPRHAPLPQTLSALLRLWLPQNAPGTMRPATLHTILAPHPNEAEFKRGWPEKAAWSSQRWWKSISFIHHKRKHSHLPSCLWCVRRCAKILQVCYS